jgi:hypothetical protein
VALDQVFGRGEFGVGDREDLPLALKHVRPESAKQRLRIFPFDTAGPHLNRKRRHELGDCETRDANDIAVRIYDLIDDGSTGLRMIDFDKCAGVEEVACQELAVPALGDDFICHRSGNLSEPRANLGQVWDGFRVPRFPIRLL